MITAADAAGVNAAEGRHALVDSPSEAGLDLLCARVRTRAPEGAPWQQTPHGAKAALVAGSTIALIVLGLFSLSFVITSLLGFPSRLNLPTMLRLAGCALLVAGLGPALWLFRYRSPSTMIVSTYLTFVKMFTGAPISGLEGRTEPLVVDGPQKYVRHPLYLGATAMFLGWALLSEATSSLAAAVSVLLWFRFVQIPFEERELRAIFGDQYARYSDEVPMLIPFSRRKRRGSSDLTSPIRSARGGWDAAGTAGLPVVARSRASSRGPGTSVSRC